ncbi:uncharacterized protein G2W53_041125 [Senna tora]|uniref:Uncharacterized protein n=1 Tax=Senna tora TaxID=362788 RepID=A0A834SEP5_9FABA|nr:uncharacterized protein G2W53_041125 [Senna tora]
MATSSSTGPRLQSVDSDVESMLLKITEDEVKTKVDSLIHEEQRRAESQCFLAHLGAAAGSKHGATLMGAEAVLRGPPSVEVAPSSDHCSGKGVVHQETIVECLVEEHFIMPKTSRRSIWRNILLRPRLLVLPRRPWGPWCSALGNNPLNMRLVKLQDIIFTLLKEVAIQGRKGARMVFPHLISDLYKMARVRTNRRDLVFRPLWFMNYDRLEYAELVPGGRTQHRKGSKGKNTSYMRGVGLAADAPADVPSNSRKGKETMVALDFKDDDDEMAEGDS